MRHFRSFFIDRNQLAGFFKACASQLVHKLNELSVENLTDLTDAFTHCSEAWQKLGTLARNGCFQDASTANWAMYWLLGSHFDSNHSFRRMACLRRRVSRLLQERRKRPSRAGRAFSTASTERPGEGDGASKSLPVCRRYPEFRGRGHTAKVGSMDVALGHVRPFPSLGDPWKARQAGLKGGRAGGAGPTWLGA